MSNGTFYRAFEDRYRGDRDVIKQRLRAYAPFLDAMAALATPPAALDLGCGRGEWLELLGEHGFNARGVDLDAGMLAACIERGLQVELADAVAALRTCADNSLALVSAFHLVEHIPFAVLQTLIGEALRVLQPGGLLIMETPNPENLSVGATSFYLDPSHEKPLPPPLLGFLTEFAGFGRQRTVRLQEPAALHQPEHAMVLIDVLENVSPDYAIVAQKAADAACWAGFDQAWQRDYGYSLGALAARYDAAGAARLAELHGVAGQQAAGLVALNQLHAGLATEVSGAQHGLQTLSADLVVVHGHLAEVHQRIDHANQATQEALAHAAAMHQQVLATQQQVLAAQQQVADLLNSNSWKLTAPYRLAGRWVLRGRQRGKHWLRGPLLQLMRAVLRQPLLRVPARSVMARFPGLKARLRGMLYQPSGSSLPAETLPSDGDLSPRAAQAYQELKQTLETRSH
jgi:O-antigen chain-terminating methyltransferase